MWMISHEKYFTQRRQSFLEQYSFHTSLSSKQEGIRRLTQINTDYSFDFNDLLLCSNSI